MKKTLIGLMLVSSFSAFAAEGLKVKCSYTQDISTSEIEQTIKSLAQANSNSGHTSFVSQSVAITEGQQVGDRALVCVTSKI